MIVACAVYSEGRRRPEALELRDACEAGQEPGAFVWVDLYEPTATEFRALQQEFSLHPLAVEDAVGAHERPKLERYDGVTFLVVKTATYDDAREEVDFGEIMVFAGENFVLSARHGEGTDIDELRARLEGRPEGLAGGPAVALHAVLDHVVDGYEPVVRGLQGDIDEVEEGLFSDRGRTSTRRIYSLGREVLEFSRAVGPLVEPLERLTAGHVSGDPELRTAFRDVQDHVLRTEQWVGAQRELLSNLLQANLTQISIQQNSDMRRISAWVAIVAVPTLVAGIYGMNFEHMPELGWRYGYPMALAIMAVVCTTLYVRFKRAGWL